MRLFTALWPSPEALRHLSSAVDRLDAGAVAEATAGLRKFRFTPAERWHLTLCFHGDDADQQHVAERLDRRMARVLASTSDPAPPRLRLAGGGTFRGVLWIGVEPQGERDDAALRSLVRAAGGDPRGYRAHLTIARWVAGRADRKRLPALFAGYAGPWWQAHELTVVRSDLREGGREYRTVHRVAVTRAAPG
ncbi:RNA 2',3'-cyclic phosphodiesterase [Saccharopolyspora subtropica]|uniref:RNA 2',3'-cyclic phosphodiesterase n=1 Tax=Saccharopolyspora thermophila TaxID=89367 RepID=A0A917JKF0_9PSEU|nr:RNA 2',3'-cyclic phosphodiesterase [Saccharopolyspora subtropica]GGI74629.1 RNA 2',3'-cyclic phosphodiesterase [Saccharopolyspora subtropica]